ncbi:hypothetical protein V1511DRAFT_498072 [Dipodascopsis uninucleata]
MPLLKWMTSGATPNGEISADGSQPGNQSLALTNGSSNTVLDGDDSRTARKKEEYIPPQADGSDKFFGMENFGNTCYCNSILQCLYHNKPFRDMVLKYPVPSHTVRSPRKSVKGNNPHPFANTEKNGKVNAKVDKTSEPVGLQMRSASMSSYFGSISSFANTASRSFSFAQFSASSDNSSKDNLDASREVKSSTDVNPTTKQASYQAFPQRPQIVRIPTDLLKSGSNRNITTIPESQQSQSLSQENRESDLGIATSASQKLPPFADESQTSEQKKKQAMQNGPIINMDHSLAISYGMEETMFATLKDLFEAMVENEYRTGVVSPSKLIEVLKSRNELFRSTMHQDAHEFLNFLLNEVIDNVENHSKAQRERMLPDSDSGISSVGNTRWVHELFEGLLTNETKCLTCETVTRRDEQFMDLSIDLDQNCSVTACLQQFSASELMCGNNKFHCDFCGGLQEAERRMKVKQLPRILALHLKRFKFSEDMQRNVKLFHRVMFPFHLRLLNNTTDDTEDPDRIYELYAVVVHVGGGPYHGHYVAIVKTQHAGWVLYDDEMAERVDESYVKNFFGDKPGQASAYILFYQEIDEQEYRS